MEKSTWRSDVLYEGGMSVTQIINSKSIVDFLKKRKIHMDSSVNKIHSYVLPYVVSISDGQPFNIASIKISKCEKAE